MIGGSRPARVPPPNPHHVAQQLKRCAGIDVTLVLEQHVDQRPPSVPEGELQQAVRLHRPQQLDQPVGALRALGQRSGERIVGLLGGNGHGTRESSHRLPVGVPQGRQHRSQLDCPACRLQHHLSANRGVRGLGLPVPIAG